MDEKEVVAIMDFSSRLLDICENRDEFTQSDLQGAIDAVVLDAVRWGRINPKKEEQRIVHCTQELKMFCNRCDRKTEHKKYGESSWVCSICS